MVEMVSVCIPAIVDFPTPPFAEETAITFLTSLIFRLSGNPRCIRGMVPVRGRPCSTSKSFLESQVRECISYQRVLMLQASECRKERSRVHVH
jgi:hypothetical protein